ncbi:hypothetical protein SDC9_186347 [bioreactor metagenome]|uniref:Uncharacterized protein n=1 Tax=bioreactor metagenome TaxID=1076179 RepID=A0A645HKA7_9ZZZZ
MYPLFTVPLYKLAVYEVLGVKPVTVTYPLAIASASKLIVLITARSGVRMSMLVTVLPAVHRKVTEVAFKSSDATGDMICSDFVLNENFSW